MQNAQHIRYSRYRVEQGGVLRRGNRRQVSLFNSTMRARPLQNPVGMP